MEHPSASVKHVEIVLRSLWAWLAEDAPGGNAKALALFQASGLTSSVVHAMRTFCDDPPVAALACYVLQRSLRNGLSATTCLRAGARICSCGILGRLLRRPCHQHHPDYPAEYLYVFQNDGDTSTQQLKDSFKDLELDFWG